MPLAPRARLVAFEIVAPLGAGGMGEVYRARDTRLNRDVALKILPPEFALDPDRLARFKREAQLLASLNHPNIAVIHGFDDSRGVQLLILELVDGSTLADRIARGPVPLDEALPIARQIAAALEAAHEQGIVHRDLKPANVKLRTDGTVKVLDYTIKGNSFSPGVPRLWSKQQILVQFGGGAIQRYALAADGKRFAVMLYSDGTTVSRSPLRLTFVLNFGDELRRRVASE